MTDAQRAGLCVVADAVVPVLAVGRGVLRDLAFLCLVARRLELIPSMMQGDARPKSTIFNYQHAWRPALNYA